jgi:hypothetical protein
MNKLVRILNTKTGVILYRPEHIAGNAKLLKTYGWIVQDFKEEKKQEIIANPEPSMTVGTYEGPDLLAETHEEMATDIVPQTLEELKAEYELLTGKKAGNKKAETIANEILGIKEKAKSNI